MSNQTFPLLPLSVQERGPGGEALLPLSNKERGPGGEALLPLSNKERGPGGEALLPLSNKERGPGSNGGKNISGSLGECIGSGGHRGIQSGEENLCGGGSLL